MYGVTVSLSVIFEKVYPYLTQTDLGLVLPRYRSWNVHRHVVFGELHGLLPKNQGRSRPPSSNRFGKRTSIPGPSKKTHRSRATIAVLLILQFISMFLSRATRCTVYGVSPPFLFVVDLHSYFHHEC